MSKPTAYLVDSSIYVFRAWYSVPDEFSDADGNDLIDELFLDTTGDNGVIIFEFPRIENVRRLEVDLEAGQH